MELRITHNIAQVSKAMDKAVKDVELSAAKALTFTAKDAELLVGIEIEKVIDRPTPFTRRSLYVKPATVRSMYAEVGFRLPFMKQKSASAIRTQTEGGERVVKRSEAWLRQKSILPAGMYIVPGAAMRLNKYGNIPNGTMTRILSALKAFNSAGFDMNRTAKSKARKGAKAIDYFAVIQQRGRLRPGIYERRGGRARIMLAFVRKPHYKKRLNFYEIVNKVYDTRFDKTFERLLKRAQVI